MKLAKSKASSVAEVATTALANLLANEELAQVAPVEEVMVPLSRLLREGTSQGKEHAAGALAHLFHSRAIDLELVDCVRKCKTVLALVALLASGVEGKAGGKQGENRGEEGDEEGEEEGFGEEEESVMAALEALAALARARPGGNGEEMWVPPLQDLADVPYSLAPLVTCLASGGEVIQERSVEVLSRLCKDVPNVLGDLLAETPGCIPALTERITGTSSLEVKVGGTALLICAAKEHRQSSMEKMLHSGTFQKLVDCLVEMLALRAPGPGEDGGEDGGRDSVPESSSAASLVNSVALWLLVVIASHDSNTKLTVAQAGAVEVLTDKILGAVGGKAGGEEGENGEGVDGENGANIVWVSALLLAVLFCERDVTRSPGANRAIPPLAALLRSPEPSERFFAAEAIASLVSNGSRGTLLAASGAGAVPSLLRLLGYSESEQAHLSALAEDFGLALQPESIALERLFRCEDIQKGPIALHSIPALVSLLKPMPERPGAPPMALSLLTQIAKGSEASKLAMAEAGALEALTKYLSLGPQEQIEELAAEVLRIMFGSEALRVHSSAEGAVEQLVAVLRLGTRGARYSAARALEGLFSVDVIRSSEVANQAVHPLVEMMHSGTEKEQRAATVALARLAASNVPKMAAIADAPGPAGSAGNGSPAIECLCAVLSSEDSSVALKEDAADLLRVLFGLGRIRSSPAAGEAIPPLVAMLSMDSVVLQFRASAALETLLEDEAQAEVVAAQGAVVPLVDLLEGLLSPPSSLSFLSLSCSVYSSPVVDFHPQILNSLSFCQLF